MLRYNILMSFYNIIEINTTFYRHSTWLSFKANPAPLQFKQVFQTSTMRTLFSVNAASRS